MKLHIKRIIIIGAIVYIFMSYTYLLTISASVIIPILNFIVRILGYVISLLIGVGLPYLLKYWMDNSNVYKELLLNYQWQVIENNQIFSIAKDKPLLWIELRKRLKLLPQYTQHMFPMIDDSLRQNLHDYNYMLLSLIAQNQLQDKNFEHVKQSTDMTLVSIKSQLDLFTTLLAKKPHVFFVMSFALGYIKNRFFSRHQGQKKTNEKK